MASDKRNIEQWQALFSAFEKSNQTVSAFCSQQNISAAKFYYWRKRVRSLNQPEESGPSCHEFINLAPLENNEGRWTITLRLGGGLELQLNQQ